MAKPIVNKKKPTVTASVINKKTKTKDVTTTNYKVWLWLLLALIATAFAFWGIGNNQLTNWDDPTYITNNPLIKNISWLHVKRIFTETYFANYQPLQILSYAIEYHFFGLNASGYHWVSLLMHVVNTALVYGLGYQLCKQPFVAFLMALFFGIHPMHVESVAWAAERKDLLYTLFFIASLIAYIKYVQQNLQVRYLVAAFVLFMLSVFSKTMAVSLIPVLFLTDWYLNRKWQWRLLFEKIPFIILAVVMGFIATTNAIETGSVDNDIFYSQLDRFFFGAYNLILYAVKLIIPFGLSGYYQYPDLANGGIPMHYYFGAILVLVLAAAVFYSVRYQKHLFFGAGFFVCGLALVLQIFPVGPTIFSERYSYIPSIGLYYVLALFIYKYVVAGKSSNAKYITYVAIGIYAVWLIKITRQRCEVWFDSISFWTDVIKTNEKIPVAYNNRGNEYKTRENFVLAIPDLRKAIELKPNYMEPHAILGDIYRQQAKYDSALIFLNKALVFDPKSSSALVNRGIVHAITGKTDSARFDFDNALKYKPEMFEAYGNRGNLNAMEKKFDAALADYEMGIKINPDFRDAYRNLGLLNLEKQNFDAAISYFNQYIDVANKEANPIINKQVYYDLARCYASKNDFNNAVTFGNAALQNGVVLPTGLMQQWQQQIK